MKWISWVTNFELVWVSFVVSKVNHFFCNESVYFALIEITYLVVCVLALSNSSGALYQSVTTFGVIGFSGRPKYRANPKSAILTQPCKIKGFYIIFISFWFKLFLFYLVMWKNLLILIDQLDSSLFLKKNIFAEFNSLGIQLKNEQFP